MSNLEKWVYWLRISPFAWIGIILFLLTLASTWSFEDAQQEELHYCYMVSLYDNSEGAQGWPDFKNLKDSCSYDQE